MPVSFPTALSYGKENLAALRDILLPPDIQAWPLDSASLDVPQLVLEPIEAATVDAAAASWLDTLDTPGAGVSPVV